MIELLGETVMIGPFTVEGVHKGIGPNNEDQVSIRDNDGNLAYFSVYDLHVERGPKPPVVVDIAVWDRVSLIAG